MKRKHEDVGREKYYVRDAETREKVVEQILHGSKGNIFIFYFLFYHLHKISKKYNEYIAPH